MIKLKIICDRNTCIGSGPCETLFPEKFQIQLDNKATVIGGHEVGPGIFENKIHERNKDKAQQAVEGCPVDAIKLAEYSEKKNDMQA